MADQWVWQSPLSHLHPHPLILIMTGSRSRLCWGCRKFSYSKFSFYKCSNEDCEFVLHKECAEGHRDINHPRHSQHTLTLLLKPPFQSSSSCLCEVCGHECDNYLSYYCSQCEFGIHKSCAFKEQTIQHPGHTHTLSMLKRPLSFECDACDMKREDKAYVCIPCQFCIHVGCALSPRVFRSPHHEHPLNHSYFNTSQYSNFYPVCVICNEVVRSSSWCYSCNQCRYLVHLRCTSSEQRENERKITAEENDFGNNADLISFPIDIFADTTSLYVSSISHFVTKMGLEDTKTTTTTATINHFSHDHPLQYFEEQNKEKENDKCEGCMQPISAPFYKCAAECDFFLHKCCANFPQKVTHQLHPHHMLSLSGTLNAPNLHVCLACNKPCHGFILRCEENGWCEFSLDLVCASLLNSVITHKAHKHPLLPLTKTERYFSCVACGDRIWDDGLGCDTCDFHLHLECAVLPLAIRHRWDKHPLVLSYPPFIYHREEFYCEYCEEEMNPKLWLYHCRDCDQSFHVYCLQRHDQFSNIKHKSTAIAQCEGHKFREAEAIEDKSQCHVCLRMREDDKFFKCSQCNFLICGICHNKNTRDQIKSPNDILFGPFFW